MAAPAPIALSRDLDPWERQPGESLTRYGQFTAYLELGRLRSYAAAARVLDRNPSHIRATAAACHWKDRAAAKDAADDHMVRVQTLTDRVTAARDDAKILLALRAKLALYIRNLDITTLEIADFLRLVDIVLRHGRMLFGDAAAILATGDQGQDGTADPFAAEVEAWSSMSPGARAEQMRHLTHMAEARLVAMGGMDDP